MRLRGKRKWNGEIEIRQHQYKHTSTSHSNHPTPYSHPFKFRPFNFQFKKMVIVWMCGCVRMCCVWTWEMEKKKRKEKPNKYPKRWNISKWNWWHHPKSNHLNINSDIHLDIIWHPHLYGKSNEITHFKIFWIYDIHLNSSYQSMNHFHLNTERSKSMRSHRVHSPDQKMIQQWERLVHIHMTLLSHKSWSKKKVWANRKKESEWKWMKVNKRKCESKWKNGNERMEIWVLAKRTPILRVFQWKTLSKWRGIIGPFYPYQSTPHHVTSHHITSHIFTSFDPLLF